MADVNVRHETGGPDGARRSSTVLLGAILRHPSLLAPGLVAAFRFAPTGWWRRPPFLPVPDERYWQFRMETAYGDALAQPSERDLVDALRWSHRLRGRQR
jgi:hypothetical protein